MPLCLVLHDLTPAGTAAMEAAVWQVSDSHWNLPGAMLVSTSVSAAYLHDHLGRALTRAGEEGALLVTRPAGEIHLTGVDEATRAWIDTAAAQ